MARIATSPSLKNSGYQPHPRDFVTIVEGTPYEVPAGKIFMLTGLGTTTLTDAAPSPATLLDDGVAEVIGGHYGAGEATILAGTEAFPAACTAARMPWGITFAAGHVLTVASALAGNDGRAYGFTANA